MNAFSVKSPLFFCKDHQVNVVRKIPFYFKYHKKHVIALWDF
jgi:hypothetical protein